MHNPFTTIEEKLNELQSTLAAFMARFDKYPNDTTKGKLLSITEAAKFLNLAVPTIYGLVHRSEIPHCKRSKRLYFVKEELENYILEGRRKTNSEIQSDNTPFSLKQRKNK